MKANTHPKLHKTTIRCSCGNTFETLATLEDMRVEICSACHPFYTGQQKAARTDGRIDKFNKKYGVASK